MKSYVPPGFHEQPPAAIKNRRAEDTTIAHVEQLLLDQSTIIDMKFRNHESAMDSHRIDVRAQIDGIKTDLWEQSRLTIETIEKLFIVRAEAQDKRIAEKLGCIDGLQETVLFQGKEIEGIHETIGAIQTAQTKRDAESWLNSKKVVATGIISAITGLGFGIGAVILATLKGKP